MQQNKRRSLNLKFVALLAVLVACELAAAWLAYETLGAIASYLLVLATALNVVPVALYTLSRRSFAIVAALALFVAIVPNQVVLGQRLLMMREEATSIVAYVHDTRQRTGAYPADLSQYQFQNPQAKPYVHDYRLSEEHGGFYFSYHVGTPNTEHSYTPKYGWTYYPD